MKSDIDNSRGERVIKIHNNIGFVRFYGDDYSSSALTDWVGFPVIVCEYGYSAIDVFLIERKRKGWGRGKFLCTIEKNGK